MMNESQSSLQLRLLNCVQTIIELEEDLAGIEVGHELLKEFQVLKSVVERIDSIEASEQDVVRVEKATEFFLEEIRGPLQQVLPRKRRGFLLQ